MGHENPSMQQFIYYFIFLHPLSLSLPCPHNFCSIHYTIKLLRGLRNRIGDLKKLANVIVNTVFLSGKVVVDDQMPNRVFYDRARVKVPRGRRY